jgi:hypothetical protein
MTSTRYFVLDKPVRRRADADESVSLRCTHAPLSSAILLVPVQPTGRVLSRKEIARTTLGWGFGIIDRGRDSHATNYPLEAWPWR